MEFDVSGLVGWLPEGLSDPINRTRREHRVKPSPYPPEWNSYLLSEGKKLIELDCDSTITLWRRAIQAIEEHAQASEDDEDYRPQLEPSKITYMMDPLRMYLPRRPSPWFH
nr:hypothetical protein [Tanacetum cinerariifolium]